MIRGIGDPLIAAYARCYLLRVGLTVSTEKEYIRENFNDFLSVYHTVDILNYYTFLLHNF